MDFKDGLPGRLRVFSPGFVMDHQPESPGLPLAQVCRFLDNVAPPELAESWDNVGLQVGDPAMRVKRALIALDVSAAVLDEAKERGAALVVSHHPLIFRPLKTLRSDDPVARLVVDALCSGIALFAMHTNLDGARGGLCDLWADWLGLTKRRPLIARGSDRLTKVVVFVPVEHTEAVRQAMCQAGGGNIGEYGDCSFRTRGTGTFRGSAGSNPFLGEKERLEEADENRLEMLVAQSRLGAVLSAMIKTHPYEEVAHDLYPLDNPGAAHGLGLVGELEDALPGEELLVTIKKRLGVEALPVAGDLERPVKRVGLCTGSGGDLVRDAIAAGCDLYLTGDLKYHQAQLARDSAMIAVDGGHFASEMAPLMTLAARFNREFPAISWLAGSRESDPLCWR